MSQTRGGVYYTKDDTSLGFETDLRKLKYIHRKIFIPIPHVEERPRVSMNQM